MFAQPVKLVIVIAIGIFLGVITTPPRAQEAQEVPDTLALSDEDAQTCKTKGCRTITDAAYEMIAERLRRAEEIEAIAQRLARELAKKPAPQFCS